MIGIATRVQSDNRDVPESKKSKSLWQNQAWFIPLLVAVVLNFAQLNQEGYANTYYAAGVKSMLTSWHNFFFVSFDSGGFVSLDKPPLGFWIEATSAKLFGFSGWSILFPEALAGVLAVVVLYYLVARVFGRFAGFFAALTLALMPVTVVTDRNNTIDSLLVLTLLLATWAITLAAETGKLHRVILCAILVGLGFNIKMLQAYLVLPAFVLVYLLASPVRWRTRIWHLVLALVVLLVVSLSWAVAVDLTPASQRPFVSDSGTNSELSLILGYNGLGRVLQLFSHQSSGVVHIFGIAVDMDIIPGMSPGIGNASLLRLWNQGLAGQASWLLIFALAGLLLVAIRTRPHLPLDQRWQALVIWGAWLLITVGYFSFARFFHTYYLIMLGPAIAAMVGISLATLWDDYRQTGWRGWLLPALLLVTVGVQAFILVHYPQWSQWLTPLVVGLCMLATLVLVLTRLRPDARWRLASLSITVGMLALLIAPATWDVISLRNGNGGQWLPEAGPNAMGGFGGFGGGQRNPGANRRFQGGPGRGIAQGQGGPGFGAGQGSSGNTGGQRESNAGRGQGDPGGFGGGAAGGLTVAGANWDVLDPRLVSYLEAQQGHTRFLVATTTSTYASIFILKTNQPAMALGGYQGWDRIVTPVQLAAMVKNGTVRFFYLSADQQNSSRAQGQSGSGPQGGPGANGGPQGRNNAIEQKLNSTNDDLVQWVTTSCTAVPSNLWQTSSTSSGGNRAGGMQLYDCASAK
jgi:4-amino-4-deoxy-L-arabinose transferase-like glycosyltransferase